MTEIWTLITTAPEDFRVGSMWYVVLGINTALRAIAYALLVLFFVSGVMKTAGDFTSLKRPEGVCKIFLRFALAKAAITYRRCTWARNGRKRVVWRCVSRLDYGTKYCHNSPSMEEGPLQQAILEAINSAMRDKQELIQEITGAMELELPPLPGVNMSIVEIESRLDELNQQTRALVAQAAQAENAAAYTEQLKIIMDEAAELKEKRAEIEKLQQQNSQANLRIETAAAVMEQVSAEITQWDEPVIRGLVDTVKVISKDQIEVYLRGGSVVKQEVRN